jgi:hypothetical protein
MYAAEELIIYDGAPIEGYVPPIETTTTVDGKVEATHRKYSQQDALYFDDPSANHKSEGWQLDVLADQSGPLQGQLRKWVEERISWYTGSNKLLHLRSWWSVLTTDTKVPKHTHIYQTKKKTISGIVWMQGDICPLYVKVPGEEVNQINNVPGRCVLFSAQTEHWTDPYPHATTRAGISFDFCIQDQECCACVNEEVCFRCVHLTKNLQKVGINAIYSGGSTTIKYDVENAIVKNPLINMLPKSYK